MHIELGFFAGDQLLARGCVTCAGRDATSEITGHGGHAWTIKTRFAEPASPVELECTRDGTHVYAGALRVGVHTSDDWESINLADIHTLAFRCRVDQAGTSGV
ncbi:MAG: hypothetical protein ACE37K_08335 [Planctomycetota bacterium]